MATIDTSIYQNLGRGIQPIQAPDVAGSMEKGMRLSQLARQRKLEDREDEESEAVRAAFKANVGPDGQVNKEGVLSSLAKINPEKALAYKSQFGKQDLEALDAKAKKLDFALNQNGMIQQFLENATDQQSWSAGLQKLTEMGVDVSKQPQQFDPGYRRQNYFTSLKFSERLAAEKQKLDELKQSQDFQIAQAKLAHGEDGLTPGQKMADQSFSKDASDYYYGGGKAGVEKNIARLEGAIEQLQKKKGLTGGLTTRIPGLNSDAAQDTLNPEMASVRDDIRAAIQGTLKQTLGAQFTEKEAEAMFNRAFNPRLSAEENIKRVTAELNALKRMAAEKDQAMEQFLAKGTLRGYQPGRTNTGAEDSYARVPQPSQGGGGIIPEAQAAPMSIKPGQEMKGYVFMGGDPTDKKNWKRAR